jgi:hypothetical protein
MLLATLSHGGPSLPCPVRLSVSNAIVGVVIIIIIVIVIIGTFQGSLTVGKESTINTYEGHVFFFTEHKKKKRELARLTMTKDKVRYTIYNTVGALFSIRRLLGRKCLLSLLQQRAAIFVSAKDTHSFYRHVCYTNQ